MRIRRRGSAEILKTGAARVSSIYAALATMEHGSESERRNVRELAREYQAIYPEWAWGECLTKAREELLP